MKLNSNIIDSNDNNKISLIKKQENINTIEKIKQNQNQQINEKDENYFNDEIIFDDQGQLFEYVIKNPKLKTVFIAEIKKIIYIMDKILYTPPFSILFGRIRLTKPLKLPLDEESKNKRKNIDQNFIDGFGCI